VSGDRRWWPTRLQLVVIHSDDDHAADTWVDALDTLSASVRDVVDEWFELCDDQPGITQLGDLDGLSVRIEGMRRALFALRQWEMPHE
jgi:hypothetical protein